MSEDLIMLERRASKACGQLMNLLAHMKLDERVEISTTCEMMERVAHVSKQVVQIIDHAHEAERRLAEAEECLRKSLAELG